MNPQEFRAEVLSLLDRVPPADRPLVLADLRHYVGRPAEVPTLARRAADRPTGLAWSAGDLLIAAESLGWPSIVFDGQRIEDERGWHDVLGDADAADRLAIHAELRATRAAWSNVVEPDDDDLEAPF